MHYICNKDRHLWPWICKVFRYHFDICLFVRECLHAWFAHLSTLYIPYNIKCSFVANSQPKGFSGYFSATMKCSNSALFVFILLFLFY